MKYRHLSIISLDEKLKPCLVYTLPSDKTPKDRGICISLLESYV